jgi:NaMN:DMB phosphoribosyltransferase
VLTPVLIAGAVVVVAALTWIVRRALVDDDQLGTISTQWISEHRSHERDHVGH